MKNIIYIVITFFVCLILGLADVWAGFTAALLLLTLCKADKNFLWEIPLGVLSLSIIADLFKNELFGVVRVLILIAAVIIALSSPKRLWLFFLLAAGAVFLKDIYAAAAMWAAIWYGGRTLVLQRQNHLFNSTIKKQPLQGK